MIFVAKKIFSCNFIPVTMYIMYVILFCKLYFTNFSYVCIDHDLMLCFLCTVIQTECPQCCSRLYSFDYEHHYFTTFSNSKVTIY